MQKKKRPRRLHRCLSKKATAAAKIKAAQMPKKATAAAKIKAIAAAKQEAVAKAAAKQIP